LLFCQGKSRLWSFYFTLPTVAGITDKCHHIQHFSLWNVVFWISSSYCFGWG
jgi:hypothetical protein